MSNAKHIISEKAAEAVDAAIAEALGDAYDCTRVWSAWFVGTMGPGDFHCIADDGDRIAEIRNEAIAALQPEFAALKRQRDELLAALQTFVDEHEECTDAADWMAFMCSTEALHVAEEAIASVKGGSDCDGGSRAGYECPECRQCDCPGCTKGGAA